MSEEMKSLAPQVKQDLLDYGTFLKTGDTTGAHALIKKYPEGDDFHKWAMAVRVMLRVDELLDKERRKQ